MRTRRGQAHGGDPALVDRSHTCQIDADRSSGTDAGYRLEQLIGILGQHSTEKSQRARSERFDLRPAIVGRRSKAGNLGIGGRASVLILARTHHSRRRVSSTDEFGAIVSWASRSIRSGGRGEAANGESLADRPIQARRPAHIDAGHREERPPRLPDAVYDEIAGVRIDASLNREQPSNAARSAGVLLGTV